MTASHMDKHMFIKFLVAELRKLKIDSALVVQEATLAAEEKALSKEQKIF